MNNDRVMELILAKLDRVEERQGEMNRTLAVNTEQLGVHIKRCDLLEEQVEMLRKDLQPVKEHVARVQWIGKVTTVGAKVLAGVVATAAAIAKLIGNW